MSEREEGKSIDRGPVGESSFRGRAFAWLVLAVLLFVFGGVRYRLLSMPLERDEGEYAYLGWLLLGGVPPYSEGANMKFPGMYLVYSLGMAVFGETIEGVRSTLLAATSITAVIAFLLGMRLAGPIAAATAAAGYLVFAMKPLLLGPFAHAAHFIALFSALGVLLLLAAEGRWRALLLPLAGLAMGTALLMKQPASLFAAFGGTLVLEQTLRHPRRGYGRAALDLAGYFAGVLLPVALAAAWLAAEGVIAQAWFWTVVYAREYGSIVPFRQGVANFLSGLELALRAQETFWALAAAGAVAPWWMADVSKRKWLLPGWVVFSFLSICPGLYFRNHYFLALGPALAVCAGVAVAGFYRWLAETQPMEAALVLVGVWLVAFGAPVWFERETFFSLPPERIVRKLYGPNPFPEAVEIAEKIRAESAPGARIAVLGSEPEIYFLAQRRAASKFLYVYPLMENQPFSAKMQEEMIQEIEASKPEWIVFVGVRWSWLRLPTSSDRLLRWAEEYLAGHYDLVGLAFTSRDKTSEMRWGKGLDPSAAALENVVRVYRRRGQEPEEQKKGK